MKKILLTLSGLLAFVWINQANAISICTLADCPAAAHFEPVFSHLKIDGHGSSTSASLNERHVLPMQHYELFTDNNYGPVNIAEMKLPIDLKLVDFKLDRFQPDNLALTTFELYAETLLEDNAEGSDTIASIDFITDNDTNMLLLLDSRSGDIITAQQSSIPKPYTLALISLGLVGLGFTQRVLYAPA